MNLRRMRDQEFEFGAAGTFYTDDMEIFERSQAGLQSSAVDWVVFSRGLDREQNPQAAIVSEMSDETQHRGMYRRWRQLIRRTMPRGCRGVTDSDGPPTIEQFVYREAGLFDARHFEDWLELFAEDACYWVPAGHDDIDPTHPRVDHPRRRRQACRTRRPPQFGNAYAQEPASRIHRLVSNVEVVGGAEDGE